MIKQIGLVFHNQALRSFIEVDLCRECPRQDDKGCCGHYSPVFYGTDLAYLALHKPELITVIFGKPRLTILDHSVTVNNAIDGPSYRCGFHQRDGGCQLDQEFRESVCRHFVCPGIGWEQEAALLPWREFFSQLEDYEIGLNNRLASRMQEQGLTLRNEESRAQYLSVLKAIYLEEMNSEPDFFTSMPKQHASFIYRPICYGEDWPLFSKVRDHRG